MSKAHAKAGHHAHHRAPERSGVPDGAVYIGLVMIGLFGILVWYTMSDSWTHGLFGYVLIVLGLVNFAGWRVYFGSPLPPWQQTLARIPLGPAGYGTKGGRPFAAAHGHGRVLGALLLTLAVSAGAVAGLAWLLYRGA